MPEALLKLGPWGLAYWQWIGLAAGLLVAIVAGRLVAHLLVWTLRRLTARTDNPWDDRAIARIARPLHLLGIVTAARLVVPFLELPAHALAWVVDLQLAAFGIGVVWSLIRVVDIVVGRLASASWAAARPASRALLTLGGRVVKFVLVVIAAITLLGSLGLPVTGLFAGVGIGGIALAFGAQKTLENLFGAFALGIDQPLREGDYVRLDGDVLGTVESVGLRSTRVRTLDRTMVAVPNGRLADSRIETFGLRDRCRLYTLLTVPYSTTAAQLREIVDGCERVLRAHPRTYQPELVVKLLRLTGAAFEIEIQSWYDGSVFNEFRAWRQDMLIGFVEVIERAGTSLALPAQTIHVAERGAPGRTA